MSRLPFESLQYDSFRKMHKTTFSQSVLLLVRLCLTEGDLLLSCCLRFAWQNDCRCLVTRYFIFNGFLTWLKLILHVQWRIIEKKEQSMCTCIGFSIDGPRKNFSIAWRDYFLVVTQNMTLWFCVSEDFGITGAWRAVRSKKHEGQKPRIT